MNPVIKFNSNQGVQVFTLPDPSVSIALAVGTETSVCQALVDGVVHASRVHEHAANALAGVVSFLARAESIHGDSRLPIDVRGPAMKWARSAVFIRE